MILKVIQETLELNSKLEIANRLMLPTRINEDVPLKILDEEAFERALCIPNNILFVM